MDFTNNSPPDGVTLKNNEDGTTNPKYIDLLDEDKPIAGQKFACLSYTLLVYTRVPERRNLTTTE